MSYQTPDDLIKEKLQTLRSLIHRESELRNNRLTWLLTSQSILFLAFSNFFKESVEINAFPMIVVALLGLMMNITIDKGLKLCTQAVEHYREIGKSLTSCRYILKNQYMPLDYDVSEHDKSVELSSLPWETLPCFFGIAWISLLLMIIIDIIRIK